jgi:hypothetical protein
MASIKWIPAVLRMPVANLQLGRWALTTHHAAQNRGSRADADHSLDWRPARRPRRPAALDADLDGFYLALHMHCTRDSIADE